MRIPNQTSGVMRAPQATSKTEGAVRPAVHFAFQFAPLWICWGWDEDTNRCYQYWGTKEACASLRRC